MAISIDTLSRNKNVFNPNPELDASKYGIWDLTKSSVSFQNIDPRIGDFFIVPDYFEMRPDLVATLKMGSQDKVGGLLKINSISNPFSLYAGQILVIPTNQTSEEMFKAKKIKNQTESSSNTNTNPLQNFKKNQEQKKFQVSPGRKKFLDDRIKNKPEMILPPNVAQPNEVTVEKKNGFLIFAPNSGGGGFNTPVE